MFSAEITKEYSYDLNDEKFQVAFSFLHRKDLADLPVGWIELDKGVRASVQRYVSINEDEGFFETHEEYFDVQYVIEGKEYCEVTKRDGLVVRNAYDSDNDITFYEHPADFSKVLLQDGDFIVLSPDDAHKPRIAAGSKMEIKKIVIKVPVK